MSNQDNTDLEKVLKQDEKNLVKEIQDAGYPSVLSVWDLVNNQGHPFLESNFIGCYENAFEILVKHLSIDHHPRIKEGIIRALTEKEASKIAAPVILDLFYKETNQSLKWVMANALKTLLPPKVRKEHPEIKNILGF